MKKVILLILVVYGGLYVDVCSALEQVGTIVALKLTDRVIGYGANVVRASNVEKSERERENNRRAEQRKREKERDEIRSELFGEETDRLLRELKKNSYENEERQIQSKSKKPRSKSSKKPLKSLSSKYPEKPRSRKLDDDDYDELNDDSYNDDAEENSPSPNKSQLGRKKNIKKVRDVQHPISKYEYKSYSNNLQNMDEDESDLYFLGVKENV